MATLTLRIPDDKAERLKVLAKSRGLSVNKLFEEWVNMGIAEFDSRSSFMARAALGSRERGLAFLETLNSRDGDVSAQGASPYGLHESKQDDYKEK